MRNTHIFLAVGAGMVAAAIAACSSSSTPATTSTTPDASMGDGASATDNSCAPPPLGSNLCSSPSDTCCFDLGAANGPAGTCQPASTCTTAIQVQCTTKGDCAPGGPSLVCCASITGSAVAALEDGGLGALGVDASAIATIDASAGGLAALLGDTRIITTCASTCAAGQYQTCSTDADCSTGQTCLAASALAGVDGGAAATGGLGQLAGAFSMQKACVSLDAGAAPVDSGSASDAAPAVDSGSRADSGTDAASR